MPLGRNQRKARAEALTDGKRNRAVFYMRVSTKVQEIAQQKYECDRYAELNGLEIVGEFIDHGVTGASLDRAGWKGARAVLKCGDADILVVAKLDRLSRSVADFATLLAESRKEAWRMVFLDMQIDSGTPGGEMMLNMSACFAQLERAMIVDRIKRGFAQKKREGKKFGGYREMYLGKVRHRVTDEEVAEFDRLYMQGYSTREIGEAMGVLPSQVWNHLRKIGRVVSKFDTHDAIL